MTQVSKVAFLLGAFLLPALAFAAGEPALSVKIADTNRTVFVSYSDMPGGTFEVRSPKGEVVKEARAPKGSSRKSITLPKDQPAGTYAVVAFDRSGKEVARASFAIAYEAPTCRAAFSQKSAEKGDIVTLRWKSEHADRAVVFTGRQEKASGSERIALHQVGRRAFAVNVFGKGGVGSCRAEVTVK